MSNEAYLLSYKEFALERDRNRDGAVTATIAVSLYLRLSSSHLNYKSCNLIK